MKENSGVLIGEFIFSHGDIELRPPSPVASVGVCCRGGDQGTGTSSSQVGKGPGAKRKMGCVEGTPGLYLKQWWCPLVSEDVLCEYSKPLCKEELLKSMAGSN